MIEEKTYLELHRSPLTPLNIKIDVDLLNNQMEQYRLAFRQWGLKHTKYPRFGLPLINENGKLFNNPEPVCFPIDEWYYLFNEYKEDTFYNKSTEALDLKCFDVLDPIKTFMVRSCILQFNTDGHFKPHIDTTIPSKIIRLWGTNDPKNLHLRFDKNQTRCNNNSEVKDLDLDLQIVNNVEAGRLYIIDTNIVHDAYSHADKTYQFFFALNKESIPLLKELIYV